MGLQGGGFSQPRSARRVQLVFFSGRARPRSKGDMNIGSRCEFSLGYLVMNPSLGGTGSRGSALV